MAQGDTIITIVGNLTDDPELRFTPNGSAVANFTVASTPRILDKATNEWKDGDALFLRCSDLAAGGGERRRVAASAACASSSPGGSSSASTRPRKARSARSIELEVDEIGPSLKYATAKVNRQTARCGARWRRLHGGGTGSGSGARTRGRRRGAGVPSRRRAAVLAVSIHFPLLTKATTSHGQGTDSQAEEEGLRLLQGQDHLRRLQGHRAAAEVHLRPRQDPRAPGVSGNCSQHQRDVAVAVKNSREMALLPYTSTAR